MNSDKLIYKKKYQPRPNTIRVWFRDVRYLYRDFTQEEFMELMETYVETTEPATPREVWWKKAQALWKRWLNKKRKPLVDWGSLVEGIEGDAQLEDADESAAKLFTNDYTLVFNPQQPERIVPEELSSDEE